MAKNGLSNQLLGKCIVAKPNYGSPSERDTVNWTVWAGLQPNAGGEWVAIIDAVWTEDGSVKAIVHDVHGSTKELWLMQVNLK